MAFPTFPAVSETKEATRKARLYLSTHIKADFDFPLRDQPFTAAADSSYQPIDSQDRGESAWTQRRFSSDDEGTVAAGHGFANWLKSSQCDQDDRDSRSSSDRPTRRPSSTYRSVTRSKRQSRLRRELGEECAINVGLAHFCARRDAWTCAKIMTSASEPSHEPASTHPSSSDGTSTDQDPKRSEEQESITLLPIPPPILQEHPLRSRVDSHAYGEIYTKVIAQARTPSIPINLTHVTASLVHGWKAEGNWPPKDTVAEPPLGKKKTARGAEGVGNSSTLRKGVKAMGRAFRLNG